MLCIHSYIYIHNVIKILCVGIETHINTSQSQPGVSCINVAYGVIFINNSTISGTPAFMVPEVLQRIHEKMTESITKSDI